MNRRERRAGRIRGPKGDWLYPTLIYIKERDHLGRPTECRLTYDDETIGDVVGEDPKPEMLLVWMGERQGSQS